MHIGKQYAYMLGAYDARIVFPCFNKQFKSEPFNDWGGGRGCNKVVPVLGGDGTKIAPTGDLFGHPPSQMR